MGDHSTLTDAIIWANVWQIATIATMSKPIISIQGEQTSFHDIAANQYFGTSDTSRLFRASFREVFDDVAQSKADYGLVAIENSLVGSINEVYDLLRRYQLKIVGEQYLRISQNLMAKPGVVLAQITDVFSHPMALLQCEEFLQSQLSHADIHERHDTAEAAKFIAGSDKFYAAIGSRAAAERHGLAVLASDIETDKRNYTRFFVLSREQRESADNNKSSLIIKTAHQPGALYDVLRAFAEPGINLTKLSSRPIPEETWQYYFYIDIEIGLHAPAAQQALAQIREQGNTVYELGSYQADTIEA